MGKFNKTTAVVAAPKIEDIDAELTKLDMEAARIAARIKELRPIIQADLEKRSPKEPFTFGGHVYGWQNKTVSIVYSAALTKDFKDAEDRMAFLAIKGEREVEDGVAKVTKEKGLVIKKVK